MTHCRQCAVESSGIGTKSIAPYQNQVRSQVFDRSTCTSCGRITKRAKAGLLSVMVDFVDDAELGGLVRLSALGPKG